MFTKKTVKQAAPLAALALAALLAGACSDDATVAGVPVIPVMGDSDLVADISSQVTADIENFVFGIDPVAGAKSTLSNTNFTKDDTALGTDCPVETRTLIDDLVDFPSSITLNSATVQADGTACVTGTFTETGFYRGTLNGMQTGTTVGGYGGTPTNQDLAATGIAELRESIDDDTGAGLVDMRDIQGLSQPTVSYDYATMEGGIDGYDFFSFEIGQDGWMDGVTAVEFETVWAETFNNVTWVLTADAGTGGAGFDLMTYNGSYSYQDDTNGMITVTLTDVVVDTGSACTLDILGNGEPVSGVITIDGGLALGGTAASITVTLPGTGQTPAVTVADCGDADIVYADASATANVDGVITGWFQ